ncbi:hypothetical protein PR048_002577 [Dryococelus australis]|uniref:Integrase catalytic domain-containing protein n=1 Tax=Dryococelus australis TaxID=614101 RepID=A0ABQ9ILM0_9NEOP|nr:hypothetical protein PR048_002577 [Dryococelus australis]
MKFNKIVQELHAPARIRLLRKRVITHGLNDIFKAYLCEMTLLLKYNNGYKYILTRAGQILIHRPIYPKSVSVTIGHAFYSKYAWGIPVKNITAMKTVLEERTSKMIQPDRGTKLFNASFQKLMTECGITHYVTYSEIKASIAETFNKSLKQIIYRHFTSKGTYKWVDFCLKYLNFIIRDIIELSRWHPKSMYVCRAETVPVNLDQLLVSFSDMVQLGSKEEALHYELSMELSHHHCLQDCCRYLPSRDRRTNNGIYFRPMSHWDLARDPELVQQCTTDVPQPTTLHYAIRTEDLGAGLAPANPLSRCPMPVKEGVAEEYIRCAPASGLSVLLQFLISLLAPLLGSHRTSNRCRGPHLSSLLHRYLMSSKILSTLRLRKNQWHHQLSTLRHVQSLTDNQRVELAQRSKLFSHASVPAYSHSFTQGAFPCFTLGCLPSAKPELIGGSASTIFSHDTRTPSPGRWFASLKSPPPHRTLSGADEWDFFRLGETSDLGTHLTTIGRPPVPCTQMGGTVEPQH